MGGWKLELLVLEIVGGTQESAAASAASAGARLLIKSAPQSG